MKVSLLNKNIFCCWWSVIDWGCGLIHMTNKVEKHLHWFSLYLWIKQRLHNSRNHSCILFCIPLICRYMGSLPGATPSTQTCSLGLGRWRQKWCGWRVPSLMEAQTPVAQLVHLTVFPEGTIRCVKFPKCIKSYSKNNVKYWFPTHWKKGLVLIINNC